MSRIFNFFIFLSLSLLLSTIVTAQTSVKLKVTQKEHPDADYKYNEELIELSDGRIFLFGVTRHMASITPLNKNLDPLPGKELELFDKKGELEMASWNLNGDFVYIVLKEFLKKEKQAKYFVKVIDLNTKSFVGGIRSLGTYNFETKREADYHGVSINFLGDEPYIINVLKGNEEFPTPIYEIIYLDKDFKVENKITFKLKKNKVTDADYLSVKKVLTTKDKYYFMVECAAKGEKRKFEGFYSMLFIANEMGEIEQRIPMPFAKENRYDNFDLKINNDRLYVAATYNRDLKAKQNGGYFFGVVSLSSYEFLNSNQTPVDKVFNLQSLAAPIKYKPIKKGLYHVNMYVGSSNIHFINGNPVVMYNTAHDYEVTTRDPKTGATSTTYYRVSISEALIKYSLDGDLEKKTYLQKNSVGVNGNRPFAQTMIVQLNDGRLIAFYSKSPKVVGANVPLEKEPLSLAGVVHKKRGTCVYSIIDGDLNISKPREVMMRGDKNAVFIGYPNSNIFYKEDVMEIIQLNYTRKKRILTTLEIQ